ncbi:hypothetical protein Tco_0331461 [Tanacetum coccineum]
MKESKDHHRGCQVQSSCSRDSLSVSEIVVPCKSMLTDRILYVKVDFAVVLVLLLSRLKANSDTSDEDRAENEDREEQIASRD